MNINYDYYRIFYYVAKFGNITQASEYLHYNQPNVTRTIKNLENQLGCVLFNRSNRGVTLTNQGRRLYEHIKMAVSHIEIAEKEIENESAMESGIVFIGTTEIALRCYLLQILNKFMIQYPNIKINLTNYTTKQAIIAMKDGLVDFSIVTTPFGDTDGFDVTNVKVIKEIAICGNRYEELTNGRYSIKQLSKYPIVAMNRNSNIYDLYRDMFGKQNIDFSPMIEVATADQIIPMVRNNLGIGFIAEDMVKEEQKDINIIQTEQELPQRFISIIKKSNCVLSRAAKKMCEVIENRKTNY